MTWLVTGGAGYIGAHAVIAMRAAGQEVVVLDDLSSGDASRISGVPLVVGTVLDEDLVVDLMRQHGVTGVLHFAAKKQVEESVRLPLTYFRENVEGLRALLGAAVASGVESFVFSSSAAVYGSPDVDLVTEDIECRPLNPYGRTKLVGEQMLAAVSAATGLRYAALRYFNVAGASAPHLADRGASNLVPMVFRELSHHRGPKIFGDDYPSPDGTCIRDFVHVADVVTAHIAAARALSDRRVDNLTANIGRGQGVSVRDMVNVILAITGVAGEDWARPVVLPRRPGDPPRVVASAERIHEVLGWTAQWSTEEMVSSAWEGWKSAVPR